MRRAKIVCTLGPASANPETLEQMIRAGMNVARLNFSHGTHEYHRGVFDLVRELSRELKSPVSILQDLQGPKIRVGRFENGSIELIEGNEFVITMDDIEGNQERVSTTYKDLAGDVRRGDILLLDDGLLRLKVVDVQGADITTVVEIGGTLKNNKGINLPTAAVSSPSLTEKDQEDLAFGLDLGVDYVALSFVRSALDIHQMKARFPKGAHPPVRVISKIEKPQAIADLDNIINVSDGIMIARGDLGVELPPQKVPMIQKAAIRKANSMGRLSITATQMLESMTENSRPTRAEASDVANAILDGTDAVMLSGETAAGKYPVRSVQMMDAIIREVESDPSALEHSIPEFLGHLRTFPNAVARAATTAANELNVKGIVVLTQSGSTARLMMTYRPKKRIIACTPSDRIYYQMAAFWGVEPYKMPMIDNTDELLVRVEEMMKTERQAKPGDEIIVVMGSPVQDRAETN
ncbi:MAG: pyruvate kinase, partial [Myxococcota bacterium]|nr:pyruvate kinase [Myxococcota bacterium]